MQDTREKKMECIQSRTLLLLNLNRHSYRVTLTCTIYDTKTTIHLIPVHFHYLIPSTVERTRQESDNSRHSDQAK